MAWLWSVIGLGLIAGALWEAFETIILTRRVARRLRLTRFYYLTLWHPYRRAARAISSAKRRESVLSFFGPLSLLGLLCLWAALLILGFALVQWAHQTPLALSGSSAATFGIYLYMSGTTFFTLGFGDVTPLDAFGRGIAIVEAGLGFAFLALVIGYLPVIYGGFSRREASISRLDARAGSPPVAAELLRRTDGDYGVLEDFLRSWEGWSAELLESHLSYPVLCFYRSQHTNQSWLAALVCLLDTCALLTTALDDVPRGVRRQAQLTFAMARHALIDLTQILSRSTDPAAESAGPCRTRDEAEALRRLAAGRDSAERLEAFEERCATYEPQAQRLADYLLMPLPPLAAGDRGTDNWRTGLSRPDENERQPQHQW